MLSRTNHGCKVKRTPWSMWINRRNPGRHLTYIDGKQIYGGSYAVRFLSDRSRLISSGDGYTAKGRRERGGDGRTRNGWQAAQAESSHFVLWPLRLARLKFHRRLNDVPISRSVAIRHTPARDRDLRALVRAVCSMTRHTHTHASAHMHSTAQALVYAYTHTHAVHAHARWHERLQATTYSLQKTRI